MASFDFSLQTATLKGLNIGTDMVIPSTLGDETQDGRVRKSEGLQLTVQKDTHTHTQTT